MCTVLLSLSDLVEALFDVTSLPGYLPLQAICTVALLSIITMDGIVGRRCVDSHHCLVLRYVML
jgi:hypothetical protein